MYVLVILAIGAINVFQARYISDLFKKPPLWVIANKLTELHDYYGNGGNNGSSEQYQIQSNEPRVASHDNYDMGGNNI